MWKGRLLHGGRPFFIPVLRRSSGASQSSNGNRTMPHAGQPYSPPQPRRLSRLQERVVPQRMSRSEEHTSELQSLMRTSYAVFCLKKNNNTNIIPPITQDKHDYQLT